MAQIHQKAAMNSEKIPRLQMLLQLIKCCRAGKGFVPDIDLGFAFVSAAKKYFLRREETDFPVVKNGYPDELSC